ncbi:unnamed protein product, partial [Symbiodinium pilosum]
MAPEPAPPPGDKIRKLELTGLELQAREEKLLDMWARKLREELQASSAPVLIKLEGSLIQPGTRSGRPVDLVDHLLIRKNVQATEGRVAWATTDKIVEMLSEGAPLTKRAVPPDMGLGQASEVLGFATLVGCPGDQARGATPRGGAPGYDTSQDEDFGAKPEDKRATAVRQRDGLLRGPSLDKDRLDLIKEKAPFKRDYLLPRMRPDMASFEKKMAGHGDAVVATAAVLSKIGLPSSVQGYWTEHSERAVLPTALAILGVTDSEKDILGRWKLGYLRPDDRHTSLDEREIAANLIDWLQDRRKLGDEAARAIVEPLAFNWKHGMIRADVVPLITGESEPIPEEE